MSDWDRRRFIGAAAGVGALGAAGVSAGSDQPRLGCKINGQDVEARTVSWSIERSGDLIAPGQRIVQLYLEIIPPPTLDIPWDGVIVIVPRRDYFYTFYGDVMNVTHRIMRGVEVLDIDMDVNKSTVWKQ